MLRKDFYKRVLKAAGYILGIGAYIFVYGLSSIPLLLVFGISWLLQIIARKRGYRKLLQYPRIDEADETRVGAYTLGEVARLVQETARKMAPALQFETRLIDEYAFQADLNLPVRSKRAAKKKPGRSWTSSVKRTT